jgi:hypothetical protein
MDSTNYELVDPCDIDDGELAGVPAPVAFVLGAEWSAARAELSRVDREFTMQVHRANERRVLALAARRGRRVTSRQLDNEWSEISVGARVVQ